MSTATAEQMEMRATCARCGTFTYAPRDLRLHDVMYRREATVGTVDPLVVDTYRVLDCPKCCAVVRMTGALTTTEGADVR